MCDVKLTTRTVRVYLLDGGRSGAQLAPVAMAPWEKGAIWLRSLAETFFPRPLLTAPYAASYMTHFSCTKCVILVVGCVVLM
jgi:hypothetical protein